MANVGEKGYFVAEGAGIHIKVLEIIEIKNKSMNPKTLAPGKKKTLLDQREHQKFI